MPSSTPRILFCVLNWGLGHATRSIPVISEILNQGCEVELASDGGPLKLLQKTFPDLVSHELPAYNIHYPSRSVVVNAISQMHRMVRAVKQEKKAVARMVADRHYDAIVSDNRYGCHHTSIPCALITHQLRNLARSSVLSKPGEWIVDSYLRNFSEIWIPDTPDRDLSGKMTDMKSYKIRFVGHLSDQERFPLEKAFDVAAILSGPEPQRSYLEEEIRPQLEQFSGKTALVRGVIEETEPVQDGNLSVYPYRDRSGIGEVLNSTSVVVCRTGYSSLMDLLNTGTKAILIPTPGQPEQEYLGEQLKDHTQFVVQQQGKIRIAEGVNLLASRPPTKIGDRKNELLGEVVGTFLRRVS